MVRILALMKPQSPARVQWETSVTERLCELLGCDYGDASGVLDAHASLVDELFSGGSRPDSAASVLVNID